MDPVFNYIDANADKFVSSLATAIAIESVSGDPDRRPQVQAIILAAGNKLVELGGTYELHDPGMEDLPDGSQIPLPKILFGELGNDPTKKTLLVYGHLDVQPAEPASDWDSPPFTLDERDGKLYGRGATDDKGPVLAGLHAIEAYKETNTPLPVNLKFVYEGMEESGDGGIKQALEDRQDTWLSNVDFVMISDNYWLGKEKPCLTYGLRGLCYFNVTIQCASKDLHSGVVGGSVYEAMTDLFKLMNSLVATDGEILVPGISTNVLPVTEDELALYNPIDFDMEEFRQDNGAYRLRYNTKTQLLMHRWRFPNLSLHGIEGASYGPEDKTVIPYKVTGKFSIRLVPNMTPEEVERKVKYYLNKLHHESGSPNPIEISMDKGSLPWVSDFNDTNFTAGRNANLEVYQQDPDLTREGGSIPVTLTLQETTGKNVMLLPIGTSDDGAHSQNEKINRSNYINGTKVLASYFNEVSKLTHAGKK